MEEFTPIAMKCTQEQFNAVKPKLKGLRIEIVSPFLFLPYLVNNKCGEINHITNCFCGKYEYNREIHEEWNEEIFLKACGIEAENLQEKVLRLENELKEVKQQIEDSRIKAGDWVYCSFSESILKYTHGRTTADLKKITDQELINKLNELIK